MKKPILITANVLAVFLPLISAQAEILNLSVSKEVKVPVVNAEVTVVNGRVTESNCDSLTETNNDGVKYRLNQDELNFFCVPNPAVKIVKKTVQLDVGGALTEETVIAAMTQTGKQYEEREGMSKGYFTSIADSKPSCQIKNDGTVDYASCTCNSELQKFSTTSKSCTADPTVLSYYAYNCSETWRKLVAVMRVAGTSVFPPPSISFGNCSVVLEHYRIIPHALIYKLIYFAHQANGIRKAVNVGEEEVLKLVITQQELKGLLDWTETWSVSAEAAKSPMELQEKAQDLDYAFRFTLHDLVEIVD